MISTVLITTAKKWFHFYNKRFQHCLLSSCFNATPATYSTDNSIYSESYKLSHLITAICAQKHKLMSRHFQGRTSWPALASNFPLSVLRAALSFSDWVSCFCTMWTSDDTDIAKTTTTTLILNHNQTLISNVHHLFKTSNITRTA